MAMNIDHYTYRVTWSPGDAGVGVGERGDDPGDARLDQRIGAGRRDAMMGARLQRDMGGGALGERTGLLQGADLGMGAAAGLGPAATDHDPIPDQNATDSRVRPDIP